MMPPTPDIDDLARRLLVQEGGDSRDPKEVVVATGRVFRKVGEPLSLLISTRGFYSLLARAVSLSVPKFPILRGIEAESLNEDSFQGLRVGVADHDSTEVTEAMVEVIAYLVWLLVTFIGRDLALQVVMQGWPGLPTGSGESGSGEGDR